MVFMKVSRGVEDKTWKATGSRDRENTSVCRVAKHWPAILVVITSLTTERILETQSADDRTAR
jgi:hypothetical protein